MSSPIEEHFICFKCKHLRPLSVGCAAFPEDIPFGMGVLFQHDKPLPGQKNDIIFEEGDPDVINVGQKVTY
ncbi:MAG: hypothetical protein ABF311_02770 [Polaribacter sp.]